jgi:hypothetical protein
VADVIKTKIEAREGPTPWIIPVLGDVMGIVKDDGKSREVKNIDFLGQRSVATSMLLSGLAAGISTHAGAVKSLLSKGPASVRAGLITAAAVGGTGILAPKVEHTIKSGMQQVAGGGFVEERYRKGWEERRKRYGPSGRRR